MFKRAMAGIIILTVTTLAQAQSIVRLGTATDGNGAHLSVSVGSNNGYKAVVISIVEPDESDVSTDIVLDKGEVEQVLHGLRASQNTSVGSGETRELVSIDSNNSEIVVVKNNQGSLIIVKEGGLMKGLLLNGQYYQVYNLIQAGHDRL